MGYLHSSAFSSWVSNDISVSAGKTAKAAASVESESVADESEDYQEDFEEEEEQAVAAAAQKKKGVQSGGP